MVTRVNADRDRCVGGGMCALTAPNLFDQDNDGRVLLRAKGALNDADLEAARQAVSLCPSGALSLRDSTGDAGAGEPHLDTVARNDRLTARLSPRISETK
ncbi:ferredoxin [Bradyrhizobium zhanjiangense]|uniref:ferredoxin n=1 Tax=Bradyrhizobium zhanjiangense TaxID=1325107 RepID=UPI0010090A0D